MKKLLFSVLIGAMSLGVIHSCKKDDGGQQTVAVTGVTLNKNAITLTVNGNETLSATVSPASATNLSVTWSSSTPSVADVDATGKVTAKTPGTTTIVVSTVDGGKTATCNVTVEAPKVNPGGGADEWGDGGKTNI